MVKARQIIQRFQNNTNKHGLNALMQRWRNATLALRYENAVVKLQHEAHMELSAAEEKILAFERRIEEADTALIEARQQNLDLKECKCFQIVNLNIRVSLAILLIKVICLDI